MKTILLVMGFMVSINAFANESEPARKQKICALSQALQVDIQRIQNKIATYEINLGDSTDEKRIKADRQAQWSTEISNKLGELILLSCQ